MVGTLGAPGMSVVLVVGVVLAWRSIAPSRPPLISGASSALRRSFTVDEVSEKGASVT
jgi:hypothetical protein